MRLSLVSEFKHLHLRPVDLDDLRLAVKEPLGKRFDRLNLGHADALILTMDDPVLTVRLTRRVRSWVPGIPIIARARDTAHAAELYKAGATDAVPETLESSLQLSEAVLVDLGVAVGPVIASIHEKRDEMRKQIKETAGLEREPRLRRARKEAEA